MEVRGKLIYCRRCSNTLFLKHLGQSGGSNYGSPYDVYEELPGDWMYNTGMGYLCQTCAKEFTDFLREFFGEDTYSELAPCYKIKEKDL